VSPRRLRRTHPHDTFPDTFPDTGRSRSRPRGGPVFGSGSRSGPGHGSTAGSRGGSSRRSGAVREERGAVTAETVMVLPLLAGLALALVWLLSVGAAQVRTVDAARETARALARGDPQEAAVARGRQVAPEGSRVVVARTGGEVRVTVTGRVAGPGGLGAFPAARLEATAVAAEEESGGSGGSVESPAGVVAVPP
jgi:hypothetical protein